MFAKASRPHSSVVFSEPIIITKRGDKQLLMFRLGNARGNDVVEARLQVTALVDEEVDGHKMRRLHTMILERDMTPLFALSWTVMHEIDERSPFFGLTEAETREKIIGVIVTMVGHDSTYAQQTHARNIYKSSAFVWNRRFVDVVSTMDDGRLMIDYRLFHNTKPEPERGKQEDG